MEEAIFETFFRGILMRKLTGDSYLSSAPFKLGADPEFVFLKKTSRSEPTHQEDCNCNLCEAGEAPRGHVAVVSASSLELKINGAFGCDGSGGPAEIRPEPSRSALEVVASCADTLRWLAAANKNARKLVWQAGAYPHAVAIGGHVHFGRKALRPPGKDEPDGPAEPIACSTTNFLDPKPKPRHLDLMVFNTVVHTLEAAGVFPQRECQERRNGSCYGHGSMWRSQPHGWEYRTPPSWLDSPRCAHLFLTLCKIAALSAPSVSVSTTSGLKALLRTWRSKDDDAALAYEGLLARGVPLHHGDDFKARWGISTEEWAVPPTIFPPSIPPARETVKELLAHFLENKQVPIRFPVASWSPTSLPSWCQSALELTSEGPAMQNILWDLCVAKSGSLVRRLVLLSASGSDIMTGPVLSKCLVPHREEIGERYGFRLRVVSNVEPGTLYLKPALINAAQRSKLRKFLTAGFLPLWHGANTPSEEEAKKQVVDVQTGTKTLFQTEVS